MKITPEQYQTLEQTYANVLKEVPDYRFGQHAFNWTADNDYPLYESLMEPLDQGYNIFYLNNERARALILEYLED